MCLLWCLFLSLSLSLGGDVMKWLPCFTRLSLLPAYPLPSLHPEGSFPLLPERSASWVLAGLIHNSNDLATDSVVKQPRPCRRQQLNHPSRCRVVLFTPRAVPLSQPG